MIALPFFGSAVPAFAEGDEPGPSSTSRPHGDHRQNSLAPSPRPSQPQSALPQFGQPDEQDEDTQKQSQIAKKYGDEREVATPPLIVKPVSPAQNAAASSALVTSSVRASSNNVNGASLQQQRRLATKYISQPLNVALHQLPQTNSSKSAANPQIKAFDTAKNAPVIQNIHRDELGSPTQEFLAKAYFGLAVMVIFGALLATYAFRKLKASRVSGQNDGWLDLLGE
jgi:hypothetical protein